ncbi:MULTISPECIES: DUF4260 domain-containing protein [unclassified Streptomyces]|uniref:DUF4260 domain-containing protein n=1 Tax=unclassified Streptomyces TaxID=2593676 RepID=UPI0038194BAB
MPELTDVPAATTVDNPHGPNADDRDFHGVVTGRPAVWLRVEGLAVAIAALVLFATTDEAWWLVPALFLVPDLSWFAYLAGPKVGAWVYNLMHTAPLPLALIVAGTTWEQNSLIVAGAIGLFHLGFDRVLKYGVKYDHSFIVTHLGIHGPDKHR